MLKDTSIMKMISADQPKPNKEKICFYGTESPFAYNNVKIKTGIDAEDSYELFEIIGRGKYGTVYKCCEKSTGLKLAVKCIKTKNIEDRLKVKSEIDILNLLQHPKIVQIYDAFEFSASMWIMQELIEGGELIKLVIEDEFLLTETACTVIIRQVCEAVEFIHRNHILHLDLKPENILMLTHEGNRVKIIDFGLARKYEENQKTTYGTREYIAPEIFNYDNISYGTDMWSLGVICYVLLSGLSPFLGDTDMETMANVTLVKYDFDDEVFDDVSSEAFDFISGFLMKDIYARMTASEALQHNWLTRKNQRPNLAPKPINIPPPKFRKPIENDIELEKTKENLKKLILQNSIQTDGTLLVYETKKNGIKTQLEIKPVHSSESTSILSEPEALSEFVQDTEPKTLTPTTTLKPILIDTSMQKPALKIKPVNIKWKLNECFNSAINLESFNFL